MRLEFPRSVREGVIGYRLQAAHGCDWEVVQLFLWGPVRHTADWQEHRRTTACQRADPAGSSPVRRETEVK